MNMTDEQIDLAITALQAMKAKRDPMECWLVVDRDGDHDAFRREVDARDCFDRRSRDGGYKPYALRHMREVMP